MSLGLRCYICGKKKMVGRQVSHSGVRTPKIFRPNLQWKHFLFDGKSVRVRICTRCMKRLKKETAAKKEGPKNPVQIT